MNFNSQVLVTLLMLQTIPKRRGRAGGDNGIDNAADRTPVTLVKKL